QREHVGLHRLLEVALLEVGRAEEEVGVLVVGIVLEDALELRDRGVVLALADELRALLRGVPPRDVVALAHAPATCRSAGRAANRRGGRASRGEEPGRVLEAL